MAVAALIGFAILLVAAFGARTLVHLRRTGTSGWLMPATPAARVGDALFTLGALGTLLSPALERAGTIAPLSPLHSVATATAGATLVTVGATIALVAQAQMGAVWRAGIDLSNRYPLVRHGLFRVVRNPFYLGISVASAGSALMIPTVIAFAATATLVTGCNIDVRLVEEPHLRGTHGDAYAAYVADTPRFVPLRFVRRFRDPQKGGE